VGTAGRKTTEYQIVWKVALELKAALEREGFHVVLTKPNQDANISNRDRAETANRAHAALFLRLHCDADRDSGFATFYPAKQGRIGKAIGPSLAVIRASRKCAERFHAATLHALRGALKDRGVRTDSQTAVGKRLGGALEGSIFSEVPVVLLELCILRNPKDEDFIVSKAGRKKLVEALVAGTRAAVSSRKSGHFGRILAISD
jgi:N-acetylmuramoyl-L-alanine amidase